MRNWVGPTLLCQITPDSTRNHHPPLTADDAASVETSRKSFRKRFFHRLLAFLKTSFSVLLSAKIKKRILVEQQISKLTLNENVDKRLNKNNVTA